MNQRVRGVIISEGKIALIRRERENAPTYYIVPGGGVEENETIEQALHREIKEELGIEIAIGELFMRHQYEAHDGELVVHYLYLCTQTGGTFGMGDGPEYQPGNAYEKEGTHDPVWVPLSEVAGIDLKPEEFKKELLQKYC
jgi:mutator protein MutT